jgi:intracellular multiplication protein IcmP
MPAAPQSSGGGGQGDHSTSILWIIGAIFVFIGAIWYVFSAQLVYFFLTIKLYEIGLMEQVSNLFGYFSGHTYSFYPLKQSLESARASSGTVTFQQLMSLGSDVGKWLRIPLSALLILLGIVVYLSSTTRVFKQIYNMRDFAKLESKNWPQITPVMNLDLLSTDIDTGPWAMAQTPMQFCKKYKLLEEVRPMRREGMSRKEWDKIEVVLKRGQANKIFAMQLGPLWRGVNYLPPHAKALFAVFAARINADSKAAGDLLKQLSTSSQNKQLNYQGVDALLKKHADTKAVKQITDSYAYVSTVMASMLLGARDDGVQASADFLWLKPLDRKLWYTLNTVGRQTPFIEVAGIYAHWISEREAGRKLIVPMVEEATNAVEVALKEIVYRKEEEEA